LSKGKYNLEEVKFHHIILEGKHYEIGEQIGDYIKQDKKRLKKYTSKKLNPKKFGFDTFESLRIFYENICPGISDELQGVADELNLSIEQLLYWGTSLCAPSKNNCSQVAVLSSITESGHSYFGRNYDFDTTRDDCVLCTTKVQGKASHIGFTAFLHGRHDGMNEHGLVASLSGGGVFGQPHTKIGVVIWVAIRAILDSCKTVDDALKLVKSIPVGDFDNLLLLDRNQNAALVEFADGKKGFKQISGKDSEGFVFAVNHFKLPEIEEFNKLNYFVLSHSIQRSNVIHSILEGCTPQIKKDDIQRLLSTHHPNGLCNHYYNDGFGTLWSVIYNATAGEADVCFGAPTHNEYKTFKIDGSKGIKEYTAIAPIIKEKFPT
jgi:predicted choloylglycine hydrolase